MLQLVWPEKYISSLYINHKNANKFIIHRIGKEGVPNIAWHKQSFRQYRCNSCSKLIWTETKLDLLICCSIYCYSWCNYLYKWITGCQLPLADSLHLIGRYCSPYVHTFLFKSIKFSNNSFDLFHYNSIIIWSIFRWALQSLLTLWSLWISNKLEILKHNSEFDDQNNTRSMMGHLCIDCV